MYIFFFFYFFFFQAEDGIRDVAVTGVQTCALPISFAISLGVVPEEISEWKPEMAPQAMVMKQNGKILPAKMGPVPSVKRVKAGNSSVGRRARIPPANSAMVPRFTNALR